ncbi:MAG TPA: cupin domain-containing protein [Gemmatimonadaceae bacterium]|nr:cupin domain-containing protein [Gemmatimonadaceae bacterium]
MTILCVRPRIWIVALVSLMSLESKAAFAQFEPSCVENSPERRGEIGCSIVEIKPVLATLKAPLFWHIDRFASSEKAKAAVGPTSVALDAHGASWLLSIESLTNDHHGGEHVAQVDLPALPPAAKYSMLVISAYIPAGMTSRFHLHSGVEAFYTVDGEQCLETPTVAYKMPTGGSFAIAAGVPMRLVATGSTPRRALAIIVYDAAQPPTTRMETEPTLVSCK